MQGEDHPGQVQRLAGLGASLSVGRGLILHVESRTRTCCPLNVSKIPSPLLSVEHVLALQIWRPAALGARVTGHRQEGTGCPGCWAPAGTLPKFASVPPPSPPFHSPPLLQSFKARQGKKKKEKGHPSPLKSLGP